MKTAYVFPGQGAQYPGMGLDLYQNNPLCRDLMDEADQILGFSLTQLMFHGSPEDLRQTRVTQPAVYLHSVALARSLGNAFRPDMVAGHSLGEFSALTAAGALSFQDGLRLVAARAQAMQKACELQPSTMAAVLRLSDSEVEEICRATGSLVVPANYNCPGQLVISGTLEGVSEALALVKERRGRALPLSVGGAFHSPLMEPARQELALAIEAAPFARPCCPVYQNVTALPETDPDAIRRNLIAQLTSPVRWTAAVQNMIAHGAQSFVESGPGAVLQGLIKKINPDVQVSAAANPPEC